MDGDHFENAYSARGPAVRLAPFGRTAESGSGREQSHLADGGIAQASSGANPQHQQRRFLQTGHELPRRTSVRPADRHQT
ncbi:hypothetical protein D3C78_1532210 [compost metagenome]